MRAATKLSKIARWGNSLGVRIPQEVAEELNLKAGGEVQVVAKNGVITVRPAMKKRRKFSEAELLKGVTPDLCGPDLIPDRQGKELL